MRSLYPSPHPCDAALKRFRDAGFNVGVCGRLVHVTRPGGEFVLVALGATETEACANAIKQARTLGCWGGSRCANGNAYSSRSRKSLVPTKMASLCAPDVSTYFLDPTCKELISSATIPK